MSLSLFSMTYVVCVLWFYGTMSPITCVCVPRFPLSVFSCCRLTCIAFVASVVGTDSQVD